jgi:hypothetical protein
MHTHSTTPKNLKHITERAHKKGTKKLHYVELTIKISSNRSEELDLIVRDETIQKIISETKGQIGRIF